MHTLARAYPLTLRLRRRHLLPRPSRRPRISSKIEVTDAAARYMIAIIKQLPRRACAVGLLGWRDAIDRQAALPCCWLWFWSRRRSNASLHQDWLSWGDFGERHPIGSGRGPLLSRPLVSDLDVANSPSAEGLLQLRAMLAEGRQPPIGETLSFSLIEVDSGHAVFEGKPDRSVYNPLGFVHGGYAATLLDSACGMAVHSKLAAHQAYTTLELKVSYLRGLTDRSGTVRAVGRVTSISRHAAFAEATLHDVAGRLCATATSTLMVFDRAR